MIIDIDNMSIKDISNQIRKLENELEYYVNQKSVAFQNTQPNCADPNKVNVQGGHKSNMMDDYVISIEKLDNKIRCTKTQIKFLTNYINKELKRIDEYEPLKAKIVKLREENKRWCDVSRITMYSVSSCRRIFYDYGHKKKEDN